MKKLIYSQEDLDLILSLELDKYKNVFDKIKKMFENNNLQEYYYGMSYEFAINDLNDNIIETYKSIMTVAKKLDVNGTHITDVCKGRRKTAYGYKWRYIDE